MKDEWKMNPDGVLVDYDRSRENWSFSIPSKMMKYIGYLLTHF